MVVRIELLYITHFSSGWSFVSGEERGADDVIKQGEIKSSVFFFFFKENRCLAPN